MNYELRIMRKNSRFILLVAALLLVSCSVYDNYDIDLMQDATASIDSSSSKTPEGSSDSKVPEPAEGSSSSKKDTTYVVIVNPSSSSQQQEPAGSSAVENPGSSSSESAVQSSSSVVLSSSSKVDDFVCGTSKMKRGDIEYETVKIRNTCWTAENMRNSLSSVKTFACYDNDESNCEKYGMLYSYEAAESVCPAGWRLPTLKDLQDIDSYLDEYSELAGTILKSKDGWVGEADPGTDEIGFNALPAGVFDGASFSGMETVGYWWTSYEKTRDKHAVLKLTSDDDSFYADENKVPSLGNTSYASVRCVKE